MSIERALHSLLNRGPTAIEGGLDHSYPNLVHVPGQGKPYALRSTVFAMPGSVIRIPPFLASVAREQISHLRYMGLEVPAFEEHVLSDTFGESLRRYPEHAADVFMFNEEVNRIRPDERRLRVTREHEEKCTFAERWSRYRVTPPTVVVRGQTASTTVPESRRVWEQLGERPVRLKANRSASGGYHDNRPVTTYDELVMAMHEWRGRDYVVQQEVGEIDVSIGYYFDDNEVYPLYTTRQENSNGSVHERNFVDLENRFMFVAQSKTLSVAQAKWEEGFRGPCGFDLRVTPGAMPAEDQAWIIEDNARVPGSFYGWFLAQRLGARWWCVSNIKGITAGDTIATAIRPDLMYNLNDRQGIVCHNPGPLQTEQACSVTVLADSEAEGMSLLHAAQAHACGGARGLRVVSN